MLDSGRAHRIFSILTQCWVLCLPFVVECRIFTATRVFFTLSVAAQTTPDVPDPTILSSLSIKVILRYDVG